METRAHPGYIVLNGNNYALIQTAPAEASSAVLMNRYPEGVHSYPRDIVQIRRPDVIPGTQPNEWWKIWDRIGSDGMGGRNYDPDVPRAMRFTGTGIDYSDPSGLVVPCFGAQQGDSWTALAAASPNPVFVTQEDMSGAQSTVLIIDSRYSRTATTVTTTLTVQESGAAEQDFQALNGGANNITKGILRHQGNLFVGLTADIGRRSGGTWSTAFTLKGTLIPAEYFALAPDRLYRSYLSGGLYYTANCKNTDDPTISTNWGGAVAYGDTSTPINGLAIDGKTLHVGKTDGCFIISSDGTPLNLTEEVFEDSRNGLGMVNILGYVLYPTIQGLVAIKDQVVYYNAGPEGQSDEVHMRFHSGVSRQGWIYALFEDRNAVMWAFKGRLRNSNDPVGGPFMWWPLVQAPTGTAAQACIWVSDTDAGSYTNLQCWFAIDGRAQAYFLSRYEETFYSDAAAVLTAYASLSTAYFPDDDFGFPGNQKVVTHSIVTAYNITATANDPTVLFTVVQSNGTFVSNTHTVSGAMVAYSTALVSRRFGINMGLNKRTTGAALAPEVIKAAVRFFVRPDYDRVFSYIVHIAGGRSTLESGQSINESAAEQYANLEALIKNTVTVTLEDELGTSYTVLVQEPLERIRRGISEGIPFWDVRVHGMVL